MVALGVFAPYHAIQLGIGKVMALRFSYILIGWHHEVKSIEPPTSDQRQSAQIPSTLGSRISGMGNGQRLKSQVALWQSALSEPLPNSIVSAIGLPTWAVV